MVRLLKLTQSEMLSRVAGLAERIHGRLGVGLPVERQRGAGAVGALRAGPQFALSPSVAL